MKKIILIFLSFVLAFSSCDYDYVPYFEAPKPQVELQDLPAYAYFKTGTYWIYKDSASGVEDSVYVYSDTSYSYYQSGTAQAEGNYMYYNFKAHSIFDTYDYYYNISMGNYGLSTHSVGVERIRTKPGDYVGETYLMTNRFIDGELAVLYTGTGITYFKNYFDSLNCENLRFYEVVKFFDSVNASEYGSETNFFIAKNIGIIRKEVLNNSKIWNLVRYNIIQ